jgi:glycosyltransferase involved in cell wall biosynthesis
MYANHYEPNIEIERCISLVIPCYNEEANIRETINVVAETLKKTEKNFEIIAVNDGSKDATLEILQELKGSHPQLRILDLMRNFGQTTAYQVGIDDAVGTYIIFYSGDLEIPPEEIIRVIDQLDAGTDFVNTSRKDRWGGSHALKSKIANKLLNKISGIEITDRGSGLKGITKQVARSMQLYGEWHRFLPDLATLFTYRIIEIEVPFEERKGGVSSYSGTFKSLSVLLDLSTICFTLMSRRKPYHLLPGRFFGFTGLIVGTTGSIISLWLIFQKLFWGHPLADRPLFMVSTLMCILGFTMVMIGVLGELIMQLSVTISRDQSSKIRSHYSKNKQNIT